MRRFTYAVGLITFALSALIAVERLANVQNVTYAQAPTPTPAPTPAPTPKPDPAPAPSPLPVATITFPKEGFTGEIGDFIEVVAKTNCTKLKWVAMRNAAGLRLKGLPSRLVPDPTCVIVSSPKAGVFKLEVYGSLSDGTLSDPVFVTVTITDPDNPTPAPGPAPGPKPPVPPPAPAPIAADGFRVLVVYESSELSKMPATQSDILTSQLVRGYLNSHCVAEPDGKTKAWRFWDKDIDASGDLEVWQTALKRPRASIPSILISDGKTGFEGPLPKTVDDTLALLKKYGGN